MKIAITSLLLLGIASQLALGGIGLDVFVQTTQKSFECFVKNGYTFVVVRAYSLGGNIDSNVLQTIANAQAAGIRNIDLWMLPCPTCTTAHPPPVKSASDQVEELYTFLNENQVIFNRLWINVENHAVWLEKQADNRAFFDELVKAIVNKGWLVGVYTDAAEWQAIMGPKFKHGGELPLWYWDYDLGQNFTDFKPFGGWTFPTMKQYQGSVRDCGIKAANYDWSPN